MKWMLLAVGLAALVTASAALSSEVRADWVVICHTIRNGVATGDWREDGNLVAGGIFFAVAVVGAIVFLAAVVRRLMDRPKNRKGFPMEKM